MPHRLIWTLLDTPSGLTARIALADVTLDVDAADEALLRVGVETVRDLAAIDWTLADDDLRGAADALCCQAAARLTSARRAA